MVKIKYISIAIFIVIIGILAVIYFFPNEEKKVKKQFNLLSECVSKAPGENTFTMVQKIKNIGTLFPETCELKVPIHSLSGSYTREEITGYATRGRAIFSQLSLKFYDLHISFPEKEVVKVILTGKLIGRSTLGEDLDETHELECFLKKIENKWLFSSFEVVEVLKK
jgi:hypothetical protein